MWPGWHPGQVTPTLCFLGLYPNAEPTQDPRHGSPLWLPSNTESPSLGTAGSHAPGAWAGEGGFPSP